MHPLEGRVCSLTFVFVSGHQQSGSYKAAVGVSAVRWRLRKRVNQMREQRRSQWLQRRMNERKKRKEDGWRGKMKDGEAWLICLCCEIAGFPRSANCGSEFFPQLVCLYLFLCTHTLFPLVFETPIKSLPQREGLKTYSSFKWCCDIRLYCSGSTFPKTTSSIAANFFWFVKNTWIYRQKLLKADNIKSEVSNTQ